MTDPQMLLSFFAIFIGVLLRTLLPSLKKMKEGQAWDHTYTATAAFAVLTSFITAVMAFTNFNLPEGISGYFMVGVVSFVYGWGLNDVYNKLFSDLHEPSAATSETEAANGTLGLFLDWTIFVSSGRLFVNPPLNLANTLGPVMDVGDVSGYSKETIMLMAQAFINQMIANEAVAEAANLPATPKPDTSTSIKAVKVGDSFSIAQIQELLLAGFILWKFPDGSTHQILVPKSPCLGQTLTEVGWTGIMPPEWNPIDTHN
jgi:hypothetical protein